ncbi:MAG: endonuclease/exonuclease/phosphatase family protein [Planctomycetota bacterium]
MRSPAAALLTLLAAAPVAGGATGTFLDRWDADDIRVVSYNGYADVMFGDGRQPEWASSGDPETPTRFGRMMAAVDADVYLLQEIYEHSAAETAALFDAVAPLPGRATWTAHQVNSNVIVSRWPLLKADGRAGHADALVDLPDAAFGTTDLYLINDHWLCCDNEEGRQRQSILLSWWLEDLRTDPDLPTGTPIVIGGDLNTVGSGAPLATLLTGDAPPPWDRFLSDSPPDWDGTPIVDAVPPQNGRGPDVYTWRNDASTFDPGVLDHVLFTDSVLDAANRFVLNPSDLTPAELAATGLEADDALIVESTGWYDHLPVVVDFRLKPAVAVGDYDRDGAIGPGDYGAWAASFGQGAAPPADGNGDGVIDAADYTVWRDAAAPLSVTIPEPSSAALVGFASLLGFAVRIGFAKQVGRRGRGR